ncbi:MAG: hypothetical protein AB7H88_12750 [Vicinamibacterales bacterium]
MRATARTALAVVALALGAAGAARAQDGPALRPHRLTVAGGVSWAGGYALGDQAATLRGNQAGAVAPPFTLFEARSSFTRVTGAEARVGFTLTPSLAVELGGAYARPGIAVRVSADPEAPDQTLVTDPASQYVVDVGLVWQLPVRGLGRRAAPFVAGGGGYLRQLYAGHALVETGQLYHLGGGVRYWLAGQAGGGRALGLRADVRAYVRRGGIEFESRARVYPGATVMLFAAF